jgi:hypothetical protein
VEELVVRRSTGGLLDGQVDPGEALDVRIGHAGMLARRVHALVLES